MILMLNISSCYKISELFSISVSSKIYSVVSFFPIFHEFIFEFLFPIHCIFCAMLAFLFFKWREYLLIGQFHDRCLGNQNWKPC